MARGFTKTLLALLAGLFLLFAAIPALLHGLVNAGVWGLLGLGLLCLLELWLQGGARSRDSAWEVFAGRGRLRRCLYRLLGLLLILALLGSAALSGLMLWGGWGNLPTSQDSTTAVVLGCLVKGDQPSKMLQNRLEKALIYLNDRPEARVVVTGGQGRGQQYAEAEVEAAWLTRQGIAPERILLEHRSLDTAESMLYTAALLGEEGLPNQVVLFTDGFHQLRSQFYAKVHGLAAQGVPSPTPWGLLPAYWLREQLGLCEAALHYPEWIFK